MNRVRLEADVPDDLVESLLQAIRAWEREHQHVQMAITMEGTLDGRTAEEIFNRMGFPFQVKLPR